MTQCEPFICELCLSTIPAVSTARLGPWSAQWNVGDSDIVAQARVVLDGWLITTGTPADIARHTMRLKASRKDDGSSIVTVNGQQAGTLTLAAHGSSASQLVLHDLFGEPLLALRSDGPTGIHIVASDGHPLLLASAMHSPGYSAGDSAGSSEVSTDDECFDILALGSLLPLGCLGVLALFITGLPAMRPTTTLAIKAG